MSELKDFMNKLDINKFEKYESYRYSTYDSDFEDSLGDYIDIDGLRSELMSIKEDMKKLKEDLEPIIECGLLDECIPETVKRIKNIIGRY